MTVTDREATASAALLQDRITWERFPKLRKVFEHRSPQNLYWHELAELVRVETETALGELADFEQLDDDALERATARISAELAPRLANYVRGAARHEQRLCRRCGLEAGQADALLGLAVQLQNAKNELERLWTEPYCAGECVGDRSLYFGQQLAQLELVFLALRDGGAK